MIQVWRPTTTLANSILRLVGLAAIVASLGALLTAGVTVYRTERNALLEQTQQVASEYLRRGADAVYATDVADATRLVRKLGVITGAERVWIENGAGQELATYVADPTDGLATGIVASAGRAWNWMVGGYDLAFPLRMDGAADGALKFSIPSSRLGSALFVLLVWQLLAGVALLTTIFLVTRARRRFISQPLENLLEGMVTVARRQDYSVKLEPGGPSEVGSLILNFNEMLAQLQVRDQTLAEHRRELQEQVLERTKKLEAVATSAEKASRAKGDFLARMSHEIRTPMNGVVGMAELLGNSQLDARQRAMLKTMRTSADALLEIINDILDFSKIEAEYLQILSEDFEIREVVEEICELLAPRANAQGLELVVDVADNVPPWGNGDPLRLRQVLTNLIGNAIKYTERGEIVVKLSRDGFDEQHFALLVEVQDTGAGIPEDQQARIWDAFTQVDTFESRKHGGTGLGLAITRQLVTLMGGVVGLRSKPGAGSNFWFRLPLANPRQSHKPDSWSLIGAKVLVVAENDSVGRVLQHALEAAGAWTALTSTAHRALERIAMEAGFGLMIFDESLPDMTGIELLGKVRAKGGLGPLPAIMLTRGEQLPGGQRAAEPCEPDERLAKPIRLAHMRQVIDICLGRISRESAAAPESHTSMLRTLGLNVLLVEDSVVNTEVALGMLESLGCRVTAVSNGALGVENALSQNFDRVLMDCQMPLMDGFEATRKIRSGEQHHGRRPVPIIAITANALPGDRERCLAAGMTDFISKPFTLKRLATVLHAVTSAESRPSEPEPVAAQPPADIEDTSRLPVFEPDRIDEMKALGRPQLVRKTLKLFLRQGVDLLNDLDTSLTKEDRVTAERAAHTLRSSAMNVGGSRFAALTGICEAALREHDVAAARRHAMRLRPEFDLLREELQGLLQPEAGERVA